MQLPDGWEHLGADRHVAVVQPRCHVVCTCGYSGKTYNIPEATVVAQLAKNMREETDRIAKQVLRDYSNTFTIATSKKENDMNVTANAIPTVGGYRAAVVRPGRLETFDGAGAEVLWESIKVYKTIEKAKAAAERRIADGLKAVFG